jgi:hypothetical protein
VEERPPGDPLDVPDEEGADAPRGSLADGVKKAILAGMGALFLGEESARKLAREWKLPKELIGFVASQATGARDEILRTFAEEFRRFLESEAVRGEFWKALGDSTIEIHAEIRLRPDAEGKPKPAVSATARARRGKKPRPARP